MPWTMDNLPDSAKNLTEEQKKKFVKIANAMMKQDGMKEEMAIATALKKCKSTDMSEFFEDQWVEVFRTGSQTDSAGNTKEWTKEDLETIVSKYNDQNDHEAPLVIGHPKDNAPAFGWVEKLKTDGKTLFAKFNQIVPEFLEAVSQGLYKKRSISLYPDLTLRHIGFLGAVPPAVKGLADIKFQEQQEITIEFCMDCLVNQINYKFETMASILRNSRESIIEEKGIETADKLIPSWLIDSIGREIEPPMDEDLYQENTNKKGEKVMSIELQKQIDDLTVKFNEAVKKNSDLETENKDLALKIQDLTSKLPKEPPKMTAFEEEQQKEINALKAEIENQKKINRIGSYKEFITNLHTQGKVVTESQSVLIDLMEALHTVGEFNFAEGKSDVLAKFKEFLTKQPKIVNFEEIDTETQRKLSQETASNKLNAFAEKIAKEEKISFSEALSKAQSENPDLARIALTEI